MSKIILSKTITVGCGGEKMRAELGLGVPGSAEPQLAQ